jgi:WD40 repeat protein
VNSGPFDAGTDAVPIGVKGAAFRAGGDTLVLGGADGAVYSWGLSARRVLDKIGPAHRGHVTGAAQSRDELTLVTLGEDRTVQVWTARPRRGPVGELARIDSRPSAFALSADGRTLAVGANDGTARVLDAATGRERSRLTGQGGAVTAIAFDTTDRIVTGDARGTVRSWDASTGRVLRERSGAHRGAVTAIAVARSGSRLLVTGGDDAIVGRWNSESLEPSGGRLGPLQSPITDVAVGLDGKTLAASTRHGDVARWDSDGRAIATFTVTPDTVWAIALGAGDRLAAASADDVLSLWALGQKGGSKRERELGPHRHGALDVVFVDGATVAAADGDGAVHLWDVVSGIPLGPPLPVSQSPIRNLASGPDGRIFAVSQDGVVHDIDALVLRAACSQAAASFDRHQRARLLGGRSPGGCGR